jgi:general secretion pathway protein J
VTGRQGNAAQSGFTLLEMLVALVVFGLLMVGLTGGVRFGLGAWSRQTRTIEAAADLVAADRALRRLVERLDPGVPSAPPLAIGAAGRFAFTADLPMASALPTRRADMVLTLDDRHRLVLRWTPHRRGPPAPAQESELLAGVDRLVLSYWPPPPATGWRSDWTAPVPPALVRIHLDLAGRHWPDIIATPVRSQPAPAPPE